MAALSLACSQYDARLDTRTLRRQQREFSARVGADAHRAQAQLQQAQQKGGQLAVESATLAQALEQEAAVNKQNSTEIAHLEQQLQTATKQAKPERWCPCCPAVRCEVVDCAVGSFRRPQPGFRFIRRAVPPELVGARGGVRFTEPALTALDLCATHEGTVSIGPCGSGRPRWTGCTKPSG